MCLLLYLDEHGCMHMLTGVEVPGLLFFDTPPCACFCQVVRILLGPSAL